MKRTPPGRRKQHGPERIFLRLGPHRKAHKSAGPTSALHHVGAGQASTARCSLRRTLVRAATNWPKPNEKRLTGFTESDLDSLKDRLSPRCRSTAISRSSKLADSLTWMCEVMGYENKTVQKILAGKSPRERAAELVNGCTAQGSGERKRLFEGGKKGHRRVAGRNDLAGQAIDAGSRKVRQ